MIRSLTEDGRFDLHVAFVNDKKHKAEGSNIKTKVHMCSQQEPTARKCMDQISKCVLVIGRFQIICVDAYFLGPVYFCSHL